MCLNHWLSHLFELGTIQGICIICILWYSMCTEVCVSMCMGLGGFWVISDDGTYYFTNFYNTHNSGYHTCTPWMISESNKWWDQRLRCIYPALGCAYTPYPDWAIGHWYWGWGLAGFIPYVINHHLCDPTQLLLPKCSPQLKNAPWTTRAVPQTLNAFSSLLTPTSFQ